MSARAWRRLSRAAAAAFAAHLLAGVAMVTVLRRGLESEADLDARVAFLRDSRALWCAGWATWTLAALALLWFAVRFRAAHGLAAAPVRAIASGLALDLAAQWIEVAAVPALAAAGSTERLLEVHRCAVLFTGLFANGLYTLGVLLLAWGARERYGASVTLTALVAVAGGAGLSAAALADSPAGMVWSNALLVPALLAWLLAVARDAAGQRG